MAGPVFVTKRSALETVVTTVAELFSGFGSPVALTFAVFWYCVPAGVFDGMLPVSVNEAVAPAANDGGLQLMVPPEPGPGVVHGTAGPLFWTKVTNVIVPGSVSVSVRSVAASGPSLETVIVYATFCLVPLMPVQFS